MADPLVDTFRAILSGINAGAFTGTSQGTSPGIKAGILTGASAPIIPGQPSLIPGIRAGTFAGEVQRPALQQSPLPSSIGTTEQSFAEKQGQPLQIGNFKINPEALKFLIPAITAGVGTIFPGTLPAAAGFQTGFAESQKYQKELEDLLAKEEREIETSEKKKANEIELERESELEKRADTLVKELYSDFQTPPSAEELVKKRDIILKELKGNSNSSIMSDQKIIMQDESGNNYEGTRQQFEDAVKAGYNLKVIQ